MFIIRYSFDLGIGTYFIDFLGIVTVILQFKHIGNNFENIVKWAEQNRMKKELRII